MEPLQLCTATRALGHLRRSKTETRNLFRDNLPFHITAFQSQSFKNTLLTDFQVYLSKLSWLFIMRAVLFSLLLFYVITFLLNLLFYWLLSMSSVCIACTTDSF